ncbi:MAG: hypothetical protein ACYS7Y_29185, partial [Planctomycetota bacterium]
RFDELVQPVLDKSCVSCHGPDGHQEQTDLMDLTAAKAYDNLLSFAENDLKDLAFEKDKSVAGECPARKSKLLALLRENSGHQGVQLDADSFERLVTWMDVYAQKQGSFSDDQEEALLELRRQVASLLNE